MTSLLSDIFQVLRFPTHFHPIPFLLFYVFYPYFLSPFRPASSDLWTSVPCLWIFFRCASRHDSWLLRLELTFLPVGSWIPLAHPLFNLLIVGYGASTFSVPLTRFVRPDASAFMATSTIFKTTVSDKDSVPPSVIRALLQCHQPRIHQSVPYTYDPTLYPSISIRPLSDPFFFLRFRTF